MEKLVEYKGVDIESYNGSLTDLSIRDGIDAIVNAANTALCMGWSTKRLSEFLLGFSVGGVAKAIRKTAGPRVMLECRNQIHRNGSWFEEGEAIYTSAGQLHLNYIIHAVSTTFLGSNEKIIRNSTKNSLALAYDLELQGIAYPLFGAGAGRTSPANSAKWMCEEIKRNIQPEGSLIKIAFAVPSKRNYETLRKVIGLVF